MSLLPSTSHANPTTPFWATAGSGGGGGTQNSLTLLTVEDIRNVDQIQPFTTIEGSVIQFPDSIKENDVFLLRLSVSIDDMDYDDAVVSAMFLTTLQFSDDDGTTSCSFPTYTTTGSNSSNNITFDLVLTGIRGANANPMVVLVYNKSNIVMNIQRISFPACSIIKIGEGITA